VTFNRDPVSELFDQGARRLLARAYEAPRGQWVGTVVADPTLRHRALALRYGLFLDRADPAKAAVGTRLGRWEAGFERALYWNHKWFYTGGRLSGSKRMTPAHTSALVVEWGNRKPALGVIPAGRTVRIRLRPGGRAALTAVQAMGDDDRIFDDEGDPAGKWGDPETRDWG